MPSTKGTNYLLHEEASDVGLEVMCDALSGGMSSVCRAKSIVDVQIRRCSKLQASVAFSESMNDKSTYKTSHHSLLQHQVATGNLAVHRNRALHIDASR